MIAEEVAANVTYLVTLVLFSLGRMLAWRSSDHYLLTSFDLVRNVKHVCLMHARLEVLMVAMLQQIAIGQLVKHS